MSNWQRFRDHLLHLPELDFSLDISRMQFSADFFDSLEPKMQAAFSAMQELEAGAISNPDEGRQVGHYWLRAPERAPDPAQGAAIRESIATIKRIAAAVHSGEWKGAAGKFTELLVIGIGGSALGPQFVADALGHPATDRMAIHFFDNTDPDGMDRSLASLSGRLGNTLAIVISKSGGTPETRNGMLEAAAAYRQAGYDFARHAIAVTGEGSKLDQVALAGGWLARLPMWDWVGGRTSELATVGLLPAALQGLDIDAILTGAARMDAATRLPETRKNPAALLAAMWLHATGGVGAKDMVVLPYKDRLALFSKYLQQLVMESLGKEKDLDGKTVNQGIAVYGNKGSTDQHAYVQQLREGVNNFFATFIEVLRDRSTPSIEVEPGVTSGDFLSGFFLGTREALSGAGRDSVTLTIGEVTPAAIGQLIALFERAVGLYAALIRINAYHQPGVEAGKKAAATVLELQGRAVSHLRANSGKAFTPESLAAALGQEEQTETLFHILQHLVRNDTRLIVQGADNPCDISVVYRD